jgi:acetylornithine deacetylase/succinyl-diaminopimelate desuccinylase-like protein
MVEKDVPTISQALRGILYAEIVARGAAGDLHSGVYGGIAPNPFQTLAWALAELKGRDGRINIPGLYELANPLSDAEREALAQQSEAHEKALKAAAGLELLPGEEGFSIAERGAARPTFEVHGVIGGFTGAGAKTVIPAEATAKVSLRLVPGQNPDKVFDLLEKRVKELASPGTTLEVKLVHGGDAVLLPLDSPVLQTAARALEAEFNRPVAFQREGGSIPIVAQFSQQLNLPVVMYGFGLTDDNIHAPNEKFYLPNFYHAIRQLPDFSLFCRTRIRISAGAKFQFNFAPLLSKNDSLESASTSKSKARSRFHLKLFFAFVSRATRKEKSELFFQSLHSPRLPEARNPPPRSQ